MPRGSNGTITAARQRTQLRRHVCHSDTKGANTYTDANAHLTELG
jgi:hypothetical protein